MFAIGSYTDDPDAVGVGIFDDDWRMLQRLDVDDASYLARLGHDILAVSESEPGFLSLIALRAGHFVLRDRIDLRQDGPCHVAVDEATGAIIVTNYVSGSVSIVEARAGALTLVGTLPLPPGSGPVDDRQSEPHAHQSVPTPWGSVLVSDLGGDRLLELSLSEAAPRIRRVVPMPPGSGPRHMVWSHGRLVVVGELDSRLYVIGLDEHGEKHVGSVSTFSDELHNSASELSQPSHLSAAADGTVIVLNRGRDTVATFRWHGDELEIVHETSTGGVWPRHFEIAEDRVLVANQESGDVTEFTLDPASGELHPTGRRLETPAPACVLALGD